MQKLIYIIPGYSEDIKTNGYRPIIKIFKNAGFKTIFINIDWKYKTMSDYILQFKNQLVDHSKFEIYTFGFSYGAMIAFISNMMLNPKTQFLCSMSPSFKEDIINMKKSWEKEIGINRAHDFMNYEFNMLAKSTKCNTILFLGEKELAEVKNRVYDANKKIKNSQLFIVKNSGHEIGNPNYISALLKVVDNFAA